MNLIVISLAILCHIMLINMYGIMYGDSFYEVSGVAGTRLVSRARLGSEQ
jgi:hypothetical protein